MERLEPALRRAFSHDPPGRDRLVEALHRVIAKLGKLEQVADLSPRRQRDHYVPGSAMACKREAKFGVSPTTACSCAAPSPTRSPTTTSPVAIPTLTASDWPASALSRETAPLMARPARTARSASSSCA